MKRSLYKMLQVLINFISVPVTYYVIAKRGVVKGKPIKFLTFHCPRYSCISILREVQLLIHWYENMLYSQKPFACRYNILQQYTSIFGAFTASTDIWFILLFTVKTKLYSTKCHNRVHLKWVHELFLKCHNRVHLKYMNYS